MPELPEAESARRMLHRLLAGKRIASAAAQDDPIVFAGTTGQRVAAVLRGRTVAGTGRKGKHLADADSSKFPKSWLFHHRWEHRGDLRIADGSAIVRETIGGRTAAWVPKRQK